jgi:hypothetical protein
MVRFDPEAANRATAKRADLRILLDPIQATLYGCAETERCRRIANVHRVISELPDDVGFGARKKLYRQRPGFRAPCSVANDRFLRQTTPERIVGFDGLTGIQAIEKQCLQFILRPFEVGHGHSLHNGKGGVQSLLGGTIRSRVDHRLDSPFLSGVS